MPLLSKPAFGPRTAIIYITAGALIDVWTGVWYFAFARGVDGALTRNTQFWLWGFFLTRLTLAVVGVPLGHIGRPPRRAELPPGEAAPAEAAIQQTAAANPAQIVAGGTVPNVAMPTTQGTMPAAMPPASAAAPM